MPTAKVCWRLKVPSPLPSSTLTLLLPSIGDDEVEFAVAVDVCHCHRDGPCAGGEGLLGGEGAVAVAQLARSRVAAAVGGDEVEFGHRR